MNLRTEVFAAFVRSVEAQGDGVTGKIIDEGSSIRSQSRAVGYDALRIETYDQVVIHGA